MVSGLILSLFWVPRALSLPPAVDGAREQIRGRAGPLSYYVAGQGSPVLLIHSINAAGSTYEMKPIFESIRDGWRVYAVDLPGFGFSDRSKRRYDIRLYVDAVHDMLGVIGKAHGDEPLHAVALSLASEFLARAATENPDRFRTLTFITPTGFRGGSERLRGPDGASREIPGLHAFFTSPLWSRALYDLLTTKRSIRYFLERTWGSKDVDEGMVEYDYLTTHQPGAQHAPYAFLSGRLFARDIRDVYEKLHLPIWVPHATRGDFKDFSDAAWASARGNWTFQPFESGALPHFEHPQAFLTAYEDFLRDHAAGTGQS